ncbi:MAG TPA: SpoIIE family protein phosphatase [Pyrinomonadaceae bacterium]|nr:SpoIIE family protein phosphatase [Pyrinomonadaceae bacterium]
MKRLSGRLSRLGGLALQNSARYLLVSQGFRFVQAAAVIAALGFTLTGNRIAAIDRYGNRADIIATILVTIATAGLLTALNRRAKSLIDRRFFREEYDARQILTAMSEALRTASTTQQVLETATNQISAALHPQNITIFLDDEEKQGYVVASSLAPARSANTSWLSSAVLPYDMLPPAAMDVLTSGENQMLSTLDSSLLIPISINHEVSGFISLADRRSGLPYTKEDKLILLVVGNQIATFIENEKIIRRQAEEERKARELEMAAEVQRHLFPAAGLNDDDLEIYGLCLPAQRVGGDYYDFFQIDKQHVALAIADVAGKGIAAALLMSTVQASLRCQFTSGDKSLPEVVSSINSLLQRSTTEGSYATFFLAKFDRDTRQLTCVNAGHNPPLLAGSTDDTRVRFLTIGGPIIGAFPDQRYEQQELKLKSGDMLVVYTDGVTEARNPAGVEFGEERLRSILLEARFFGAGPAAEHVIANVLEWQGASSQYDDITLIVMKVK